MYVNLGFWKWPKIKAFENLSVSCVVLYRTFKYLTVGRL